MKEQTVREIVIMPLVSLRGLTITPSAQLKIPVARSVSTEAFAAASKSKSHDLACFCQKNDRDVTPEFSELYPIGVVCKVLSFTRGGKESSGGVGMVKGYQRIRLLEVLETEDHTHRQARVELLYEKVNDPVRESQVLDVLRSSLQYARENGNDHSKPLINPGVPERMLDELLQNDSLSKITDILTQALTLDKDTKLMLLANLDPLQRAEILISSLNGFSYKSELENRVLEQAKAALERNQKEYFLHEQLRAIKKELGAEEGLDNDVAEFRRQNEQLDAPEYVHERIEREIKKYSVMSIASSESTVVRNYLETLLSIPWNKSTVVSHDLKKAREVLEEDHFGLKKVKDHILEYLAVQAKSDRQHGPIICLMGPPGIGKTSLGQSIAKATGRKYVRVSLGGLHDEAEIRGHRRTYIGALPGRIISNMVKAGVNNPLFLLDEIDKVSDSIHGDPAAALLEVLDPEQNKTFEDNYVEIEYDLSNVMFVTTANSYNISQPLLDRMEIIDLSSYTEDEKFHIAKEHLVPKEMRLANLSQSEFELADDALIELIRYYTHEAGVRGLERLISEICRKCIKNAMLEDKNFKLGEEIKKHVVKACDLAKMLGPRRYDFTSKLKDNKIGLVNGLAWTSLGGDILQLEVAANEGKGKHILTGKLGEVMKESITAAITLVRSRTVALHLDPSFYEKCDLHVHVPEGATPKEGPSAGVGMVTGIVSALTGNPVRADVAMTGEITLRGDVLPIGGLKEKLLAALRGGIKLALIPKENEKDLWEVPENVKQGMKIIPVSRIDEVLHHALVHDPDSFIPTTVWKAGTKKKKTSATKVKKKIADLTPAQ